MLWVIMYYLVIYYYLKINGLFVLKYIWILKEKIERVFKVNWLMYFVFGYFFVEFVYCFLKVLFLFKYV